MEEKSSERLQKDCITLPMMVEPGIKEVKLGKMELQNIQNFLVQVSAINKQYEKIANLTGENFNIFKIIGLSTNEVRTHSAFIAELLNPKGSHGQKEIFLQLFCDQIEIKGFECEHAIVQIEKHIGVVSDDYSEGGYIDILISDKSKKAIIIENKIYAGDQQKQLLRYYNYAKNSFSTHSLIYLTLEGKDAADWSKCNIPEGCIINISYASFILDWLEKCKEKAVGHPILRETITQYIYLIKYLTHQTLSNDMSNELVSLISSNKEYYKSIDDIYSACKIFENNVKVKFWAALREKVPYGFPVYNFDGFDFKCEIDEDSDGFYYGFFVSKNGESLPGNSLELKEYANYLKAINPGFITNHNFIGWTYSRYFRHLFDKINDKELIFNLNNDTFLNEFINKIVAELNEYIDSFKTKLKKESLIE